VFISRFIKPGSISDQPYNHYSWLRSMEDLFGIDHGGTDGRGHLGYAAANGCARSATTSTTTPPAARRPR